MARDYFTLDDVTGVYFSLDKPKSGGKFNQEPHWEVTCLIARDHPQLKEFAAKVREVADEEWELTNDTYKELKLPFKDGTKFADKKPGREWARGMIMITPKTGLDYPPDIGFYDKKGFNLVTGVNKGPQLRELFYPGVLLNVDMAVSTFESRDQGVTLYLQGIGSHKTGERIAGLGSGSVNRLSRNVGTVSDVDPTEDLDDEIPF